jgi:hypothetical protein
MKNFRQKSLTMTLERSPKRLPAGLLRLFIAPSDLAKAVAIWTLSLLSLSALVGMFSASTNISVSFANAR